MRPAEKPSIQSLSTDIGPQRFLTWLALAFGLAFAALTLSSGYMSGSGAYWTDLAGDTAKGEIGWFYYARDVWRFPLLTMQNYHIPEGSSLVLSDSLPLFGLPAKLLYSVFWSAGAEPPIYTGIWVTLCLVMQAIAASYLLRALGVVDTLSHLAGLVLLCYMPMLFLRFGHAALMGQFLILFALEGYVRARREHLLSRRRWISLCLLPAIALLVHPYLAVMCVALVAVTIVVQWREQNIRLSGALFRFASIAVASLLVIFFGGFLNATHSDFGDYGMHSMNLLSPWVPFPQTLSGQLLQTRMAVVEGSNQWEGGVYLGAGVLLLCLFALPALRDLRANVRRHTVLLWMLAIVLLFAISNQVGLGAHKLFEIPLPEAMVHSLSQLRGSGRFAWMLVYTAVTAMIVAVVARYPRRRAMAILAIAALLQFIDVRPMQLGVRLASASAVAPTINVPAWTQLIGAHQRIFQFPSFECGGLYGSDLGISKFRELEIDWIAARLNKPINSAYLARYTKDCDQERRDAAVDHGKPGTLNLYRSTEDVGAFLQESGVDPSFCALLDEVVVCSSEDDLSILR